MTSRKLNALSLITLLLVQLTLAAEAQEFSNENLASTTAPVVFNFVPTPDIEAIGSFAADSDSDIWGTSISDSMALHFNGSTWTKVPMAKGSRVNKVAVLSRSNVWAVGQRTDNSSQIQHFNGTTWSVFPSPHFTAGENLNSLKVISANSIFAVGSTGGVTNRSPLVEHFNGSAWSVISVPKVAGGELFDIAIISPSDMWAVGDLLGTSTGAPALALHFDGRRWSQVPTPIIAGLFGVTALSTSNVWAVGARTNGPVVEHWNGTAWRVVKSPTIPSFGFLGSISAISPTDIWASGCESCGDAVGAPLLEHWNGTTWSLNPVPIEDRGIALNTVLALPSGHIFLGGFAFAQFGPSSAILEGTEGR